MENKIKFEEIPNEYFVDHFSNQSKIKKSYFSKIKLLNQGILLLLYFNSD